MVGNASFHIHCRRNLSRHHRQLHADPCRTLSQRSTSQIPTSILALLLLIMVCFPWFLQLTPAKSLKQEDFRPLGAVDSQQKQLRGVGRWKEICKSI